MSRINMVDHVVGELCAGMGLGEHSLDVQGRLTLRFEDTPVTFSYSAAPIEFLWMHADLGELRDDDTEALRFVLRVGLDCWRLNRMTIAVDEHGKAWGYSGLPVAELNRERLWESLQAMLEVAMPIRERLARRDFAVKPDHEASIDPEDGHHGLRYHHQRV